MKIDATTILLLAGAGVGVYLLTRPRYTPGINPQTGLPYSTAYNPAALLQNPYNPYQQGSTTAQDIAAGGSALSSVADALAKLFG